LTPSFNIDITGIRCLLTSCPATAHSPVTRAVGVASNVPNPRVVQALLLKLSAIHVLDAPETSCSYSCGVCAGWHVCGGGGRARHCGEGTEEFGQKGHGEVEEDGDECEVDGANGCGICRESTGRGGVVYLI
jgi:hypothetical protein